MLTEEQYLLICLIEECSELQQITSKCLRFGVNDYSPYDETKTPNWKNLAIELSHINCIIHRLIDKGIIPKDLPYDGKEERLNKFIEYSRKLGILKTEV